MTLLQLCSLTHPIHCSTSTPISRVFTDIRSDRVPITDTRSRATHPQPSMHQCAVRSRPARDCRPGPAYQPAPDSMCIHSTVSQVPHTKCLYPTDTTWRSSSIVCHKHKGWRNQPARGVFPAIHHHCHHTFDPFCLCVAICIR